MYFSTISIHILYKIENQILMNIYLKQDAVFVG